MAIKIVQVFAKNLFKVISIVSFFLTVILLVLGISLKSSLENKLRSLEISNQQLSEQVQILRNEKIVQELNPPLPIPSSIPTGKIYESPLEIDPFSPKEDLSGNNVYELECSYQNEILDYSWLADLKGKLDLKEEILQLCNNTELNKAVFFSKIQNPLRSMVGGPSYRYFIKVFDIKTNKVSVILEREGGVYGGCGQITNWTKSNNIYYRCGGGDGWWGEDSLFRINIQTKKSGVVEMCRGFGNQTDCSSYCESDSDCKIGYFCNFKANNCVKFCVTSDQCLRIGRLGCYKFTDTQRGCW